MLNRRQALSAVAVLLATGSRSILSCPAASPRPNGPNHTTSLRRQLDLCAQECRRQLRRYADLLSNDGRTDSKLTLQRCEALCRLASRQRHPSAALLQSCADACRSVRAHSSRSLADQFDRCNQLCHQHISAAAC